MGRGRKGRDISGWLVIDKPAGPTSTAIVNKVRWALGAKKAGHAGTLDPAATGVLAVALGEATKTVPYVTDALKCYRFTVRLGAATNTDDAEGEVIATSGRRPSDAEIETALHAFTGEIMQVPPRFSAVKIDGQRAYALARDGEDVDLAARPLWVESLRLAARPDPDHAELEMVCGKGGYVRAIARDLGERLGCHGHVLTLRRLWSGPFEAEDGITLEEVERLAHTPDLDARLMPLETGLRDLPELPATPEGAARLRNGNPGQVIASDVEYGEEAWASFEGKAVAVGSYRAGELHPSRVFNRYLLTRTWEPAGNRALFVMLNPSTATELQNDPTVERCERRARALGFGAFRVTNIFAFRATDPKVMRAEPDPVGPGNDAAIAESAAWADTIVCAWGTHGAHLDRGPKVARLLRATGRPLHHLGLSKDGHPRHPLYIGYDRQPELWT